MPDTGLFATFRTPDGSLVAAYDLGGEGGPLLLAHATGFHAMVLAELARYLSSSFHCYALDFRAHGRSRATASWDGSWGALAEDVLAVVEGLGLERPYAFGHSLGGTALLLAEETEPGTFRQLYCYEPIVVPEDVHLPADPDNAMSQAAARRREYFGSKEEALANYASKPPLSVLHPRVLQAYVADGFERVADGAVRLRCRPRDEARVFANALGHDAFANLPKVACPIDLACGSLTTSLGEDVLIRLGERVRTSGGAVRVTVFEELDHFGPMERPDRVAASITDSVMQPPGT